MKLLVLASVATLAVAVAACGDDGDGAQGGGTTSVTATAISPPNEDDLARSALLTVDDFPTGWSEEPDTDDKSPADKCELTKFEDRTGKAKSGDFSPGGPATISQTVVIYASEESIQASLDRIPDAAKCLVDLLNSGDADTHDFGYSGASFSRLSFPRFGDRSEGYRFKFHVKSTEATGPGDEGDAYIDVVYVIEGRFGFSLLASDVQSPYDSSEFETYVNKADRKLAGIAQ